MGIPLTNERYAAWYSELWQTPPGANVKEKADWLFEHSTHSEWAIMRGEYVRQANGKQPRKIKPLPYDPRKEVPRPINRPDWTPTHPMSQDHRERLLAARGRHPDRYDTGIGVSVASYADDDDELTDDDDGWNDTDARERWQRRHGQRGKEAA